MDRAGAGVRRSWEMPDSKPPATYISDLRPNRVATLEVEVVELGAVRTVTVGSGIEKSVQDVQIKDGTGTARLVLWGEEIGRVKTGDRVRITEGWVKDYKGMLQISLGRTGRVEAVPKERSPRPRRAGR